MPDTVLDRLREGPTPFTAEFPRAVAESADWELRGDPGQDSDWVLPLDSPDLARRLKKALHARVRILRPWGFLIPPPWGLDMGFVRFPRETAYVHRLPLNDLTRLVEDSGSKRVCSSLLFSQAPRLESAREAVHAAMDRDLLTFERKQRHRLGVLVPAHCQEAALMSKEGAANRFAPCPDWWASVEDSYGARTELPPILSYYGKDMAMDLTHPGWKVFRSEWAANKLVSLLLQARAGRLYWCSRAVFEDIQSLGVDNILRESPGFVREDAKAILKSIEDINWGKIPVENRNTPEVSGVFTPVFDSGDYVPFDACMWRPSIPEGYWFEEGEVGDHESCRGARVIGKVGEGNRGRQPGPVRRKDNRGVGLLRSLMEDDPELGRALRRVSKSDTPTLKEVLKALRPQIIAAEKALASTEAGEAPAGSTGEQNRSSAMDEVDGVPVVTSSTTPLGNPSSSLGVVSGGVKKPTGASEGTKSKRNSPVSE